MFGRPGLKGHRPSGRASSQNSVRRRGSEGGPISIRTRGYMSPVPRTSPLSSGDLGLCARSVHQMTPPTAATAINCNTTPVSARAHWIAAIVLTTPRHRRRLSGSVHPNNSAAYQPHHQEVPPCATRLQSTPLTNRDRRPPPPAPARYHRSSRCPRSLHNQRPLQRQITNTEQSTNHNNVTSPTIRNQNKPSTSHIFEQHGTSGNSPSPPAFTQERLLIRHISLQMFLARGAADIPSLGLQRRPWVHMTRTVLLVKCRCSHLQAHGNGCVVA